MKITQMATYRSLQYNLGKNSDSLNKLYEQAATGKQLERASDDPSGLSPLFSSRTQIETSDRYLETIATTQDNLDIVDGYLDSAESLLVRAKEIAIYGVNDSLSDEDMQTLAAEVVQLQSALLDIANAKVDSKYIFAGYAETTLPFSGDPVVYNGTDDHKLVETSAGQTVQTNLTGNEVFMEPVDMFAVLSDLEAALSSADGDAVEAELDNLEAVAEQVRSKQSEMGNINSHLDDVSSLTENIKLQMQERLSSYEDADIVAVMTGITQAEQAYEAALSVSARVSSLSILDYL
ncbi:flagellar hook-associated protein 3 FlgL [Desulfuromusa kysingii]|uniref:Flagellar hook-associated protein 3 FlgL n=1 Tax=Desulfuromusa kysingii TaxID=37625 RepID=A0A1H3W0Q3_9BACT|nr:flagellar hook-associated protein FlgL [Desulfuromusa kysingii]SDZ80024.1 flagellar hook-associated protein 3 FlgL [Desulfuromusa kysingii]